MKRILILVLVLALMPAALAFDPARFEGIEGVTVKYDPASPSDYTVTAGFADSSEWTHFGGHLLVRYLNAGKTAEIPMILASFTTSNITGMQMYVRTDAHRYQVQATDLSVAGLENSVNEAVLLITPESCAMFRDMAASAYCSISVWDQSPDVAFTFTLDDHDRRILSLFLEEYDAQIEPLLTSGSTLAKVYAELHPTVQAESAADIGAAMRAILDAEYPELKRGNQGDDVMKLQQALIQLGHLNDTADGVFGKKTAAAVESFQQTQDMRITGVADDATQTALYTALLETAPME